MSAAGGDAGADKQGIWTSTSHDGRLILHATAVSWAGAALMIAGPSGSGKSTLALALMAFGARLIADDRVEVLEARAGEGSVVAAALPNAPGLIEARGVGLLPVDLAEPAPIVACIDMRPGPPTRLPEPRFVTLGGRQFPVISPPATGGGVQKSGIEGFSHAALQYLKGHAAGLRGGVEKRASFDGDRAIHDQQTRH